jgi:hypothetical protein
MEQKDKLKQMTAWDVDPTLSEDDLDALLADAALCDTDGLAPTDADWTPTYDLNAAAAAGWLLKAGRASILTAVDPPESGIVTAKVFDNCRGMAAIYAAKKIACVATKTYI